MAPKLCVNFETTWILPNASILKEYCDIRVNNRVQSWLFHHFWKILKIAEFSVSAPKGLKYYGVHYLRHYTIQILKVETKIIQMRPNLAGYTMGRGCWKILGPRCYEKHPKMPIFMALIAPKTPSELQNHFI